MLDSIFYPSGRPSLTAVRELLTLMPSAVVISDANTAEVLAYSPPVKELYQLDGDSWYLSINYHEDQSDQAKAREALQARNGGPLRFATRLKTASGRVFPAICSVMLSEIVDREVFIASIEPGHPYIPSPEDKVHPALETILHNVQNP